MPTEQRVIATKPKIGARPAPVAVPAEEEAPAAAKRGGRRLVVVIALLAVLGGGAAYWFLLGPGAGEDGVETPVVEPAPELGDVVAVDPVSVNLADGHYLRLGMGLQMAAGGHGSIDPSRALDLAIALFSGRSVAEVSDAEGREALKAELLEQLAESYDGEVIDLYFTDYVTQ